MGIDARLIPPSPPPSRLTRFTSTSGSGLIKLSASRFGAMVAAYRGGLTDVTTRFALLSVLWIPVTGLKREVVER